MVHPTTRLCFLEGGYDASALLTGTAALAGVPIPGFAGSYSSRKKSSSALRISSFSIAVLLTTILLLGDFVYGSGFMFRPRRCQVRYRCQCLYIRYPYVRHCLLNTNNVLCMSIISLSRGLGLRSCMWML